MAWMEPDTHYHNIIQVVKPADGLGLSTIVATIGEIVSRHESLRTRYRPGADGRLLQILDPEGDLPVEIHDASPQDAEERCQAIEDDFATHNFDHTTGWPLRVAVGSVDGQPKLVMLVVSHLAADFLSSRILRDELDRALAAAAAGQPMPPPVEHRELIEQAEFERSPKGQAISDRSVRYWRSQLALVPPKVFPDPPGPGEPMRYRRGVLRSPAVALASSVLAERYQTSTTVAILAATAVVLTQRGGWPRCPFQMMISNRFTKDLRYTIGNLTQTLLTTVDVTGPRFRDVIRSAWSSSMQSYRHGQYDTYGLAQLRSDTARDLGIDLDGALAVYFNDLRADTSPSPQASRVPADEIRAAISRSHFEWTEQWHRENMRFFLRITEAPGAVNLSTFVDTTLLPPPDAIELVKSIERILVSAATEEDDLAKLRAVTGISPLTAAIGEPVRCSSTGDVSVENRDDKREQKR